VFARVFFAEMRYNQGGVARLAQRSTCRKCKVMRRFERTGSESPGSTKIYP